jgi:glycosyltransferase involved in cell wall biosynthesis
MSAKKSIPAASVILPVFNAVRFIDLAISSVLQQDFDDFELLLLDDGSNDGSAERLHHFASKDSRCKVHSWPNRGLIATLNAGVAIAKAPLLIRMDADDICRPNRFSKQIAYLEANPDCVAIGARVMLIDADNWQISEFGAEVLNHEEIDDAHMAGKGGSIAHPTAIIRKMALVQIGGYSANFIHAEDIDLFLRLAEVGRLHNLPDVLLDYRQHIDSIGYRHAKKQWGSARLAVLAACKRRGLPPPTTFGDAPQFHQPTRADVHRKWAWWALRAGNRNTAIKHALRAIILDPINKESLKLSACVIRGH